MTSARRIAALLAVVFFAVLNAGTSKAPEEAAPTPAPVPSPSGDVDRFCHRPAEGRCHSMRVSAGYEEQAEQLGCQQANGTWDTTPCDTTNIVGRCVASSGRSAWYFSPPQWTEESARELCTMLSTMTWMPGNQ